ncbi:hypothetical protein V6N12_070201 [Hibiscus sabdariffa]|uniref:Uncharacterized protein n=1 Tax=Hibiscus sabdariffa TaxID=183260 RepID=A0ABR2FG30_9ROSI
MKRILDPCLIPSMIDQTHDSCNVDSVRWVGRPSEAREGLSSFVEMDCEKNFGGISQPERGGTVVQVPTSNLDLIGAAEDANRDDSMVVKDVILVGNSVSVDRMGSASDSIGKVSFRDMVLGLNSGGAENQELADLDVRIGDGDV